MTQSTLQRVLTAVPFHCITQIGEAEAVAHFLHYTEAKHRVTIRTTSDCLLPQVVVTIECLDSEVLECIRYMIESCKDPHIGTTNSLVPAAVAMSDNRLHYVVSA